MKYSYRIKIVHGPNRNTPLLLLTRRVGQNYWGKYKSDKKIKNIFSITNIY